jgi:hypothetical protein
MRYSVGVSSIGKIANDFPKVGRAIEYDAVASWLPLGLPGSGWLLYERLIHWQKGEYVLASVVDRNLHRPTRGSPALVRYLT